MSAALLRNTRFCFGSFCHLYGCLLFSGAPNVMEIYSLECSHTSKITFFKSFFVPFVIDDVIDLLLYAIGYLHSYLRSGKKKLKNTRKYLFWICMKYFAEKKRIWRLSMEISSYWIYKFSLFEILQNSSFVYIKIARILNFLSGLFVRKLCIKIWWKSSFTKSIVFFPTICAW